VLCSQSVVATRGRDRQPTTLHSDAVDVRTMKAVLKQNDRAKSIVSAFERDFKETHGNDRKNVYSAQSRRQTAFVKQFIILPII